MQNIIETRVRQSKMERNFGYSRKKKDFERKKDRNLKLELITQVQQSCVVDVCVAHVYFL